MRTRACLLIAFAAAWCAAGQRVPIVYSTDLFHPHDDPDDDSGRPAARGSQGLNARARN